MNNFTPTSGARETADNIRGFITLNKQVFWDIMNPLIPFIIGLVLFDFVVNIVFFPYADSKHEFELGGFAANYFYAALMISWHRVVIHGPDQYVAVNPLKPKKSELVFMGVAFLVAFSGLFLTYFFTLIFMAGGVIGAFVGMLIGACLGAYLGYKICFYLPAKAAGADITFRESFVLTGGYFWKFAAASFFASIRIVLVMIAYFICLLGVGMYLLSLVFGQGIGMLFAARVLVFITMLPVYMYFQPILTIIGVTALSNYYLHAVQNKGRSGGVL